MTALRLAGLKVAAILATGLMVSNVAAAPPKATAHHAAPAAPHWEYTKSEDKMGRGTETACVISNEEIDLKFPYHPTRVQLCIRNKTDDSGSHMDVLFALMSNGQMLSREGFLARFDTKKASRWEAEGASDGSTAMMWVSEGTPFIREIFASSTLAVEITYYDAGSQVSTFNIADLQFKRPGLSASEREMKRFQSEAYKDNKAYISDLGAYYDCLEAGKSNCIAPDTPSLVEPKSASASVNEAVDVKSSPAAKAPEPVTPPRELGLRLQGVWSLLRSMYHIKGGVQVVSVKKGSAADEAGVRNCLISEWNGEEILSVDDFNARLSKVKSGDIVKLKMLFTDMTAKVAEVKF